MLLDLDGTLVSSFTPRRAPRLPPAMKSHLVGVGSSLNPGGVFVVERPGLTEFLAQLAGMSEVVVFTAGEDIEDLRVRLLCLGSGAVSELAGLLAIELASSHAPTCLLISLKSYNFQQ